MTSTRRTRKASKADVDESPASTRRQRRPRVVSPFPADDDCASDQTTITPVPETGVASAEAPARNTKLSRLIALLEGEEGTTIGMLCEATGWQAHSVRGAIAGTLKRKGIVVISDRSGTGPRRYRIGSTS